MCGKIWIFISKFKQHRTNLLRWKTKVNFFPHVFTTLYPISQLNAHVFVITMKVHIKMEITNIDFF